MVESIPKVLSICSEFLTIQLLKPSNEGPTRLPLPRPLLERFHSNVVIRFEVVDPIRVDPVCMVAKMSCRKYGSLSNGGWEIKCEKRDRINKFKDEFMPFLIRGRAKNLVPSLKALNAHSELIDFICNGVGVVAKNPVIGHPGWVHLLGSVFPPIGCGGERGPPGKGNSKLPIRLDGSLLIHQSLRAM